MNYRAFAPAFTFAVTTCLAGSALADTVVGSGPSTPTATPARLVSKPRAVVIRVPALAPPVQPLVPVTPVPEPGSALIGIGVVATAFGALFRRNRMLMAKR